MQAFQVKTYATQAGHHAANWWRMRTGATLLERIAWLLLVLVVAIPLVGLLSILLLVALAVFLAAALVGYVRAAIGRLLGFGAGGDRRGPIGTDGEGREGVRVIRRSR